MKITIEHRVKAVIQEIVDDAPISVLQDFVYQEMSHYYLAVADKEEVSEFLAQNEEQVA